MEKLKAILNENNEVVNVIVFKEKQEESFDLREILLPYAKKEHPDLLDSELQQKILEYVDTLPPSGIGVENDYEDLSLIWGMENSVIVNRPEVGYFYDEERKAFIPPKPDETYILNEETFIWEPDPNIEYDLHNDGILYKYQKEPPQWIIVEKNEVEI